MDGSSPIVGMSDEDDDDDIHHCHLEGLLFWVQTLESNIPMPSLSDLLDSSTTQRNFVPHYYSMGGADGGIVVGGSKCACGKGNVGEEEAEEDNNRFLSLGGGK
jgi:hypothetical protein